MAKQEKQAHGGTLTRPAKGETMNPNGRPRKFVSALKDQGYKLAEVNDCIQVLMSMTLDELKDVWDNPEATVLEKTVANALKKGIDKGSLYSMDTLLNRVYGKPKESADLNMTGDMQITFKRAGS